jgi:hypothetical protein
VQFREIDLFGKVALRSRLIRTSNAYMFRDPLPGAAIPDNGRAGPTAGASSFVSSSKSENPPRCWCLQSSALVLANRAIFCSD